MPNLALKYCLPIAAIVSGTAQAAPLTVNLDGIQSADGPLYISIQSQDQFMSEDYVKAERLVAPSSDSHVFEFDVPSGAYAVSVWHDDNNNGVFDRGEYGIPLDGWAMSGGPLTGPPAFEDAAIGVMQDGASISLAMTYGR